jgi:hypothetical protein
MIVHHAEMLVVTPTGLAMIRADHRSEHPEATPVPYCAGCRRTFATTDALQAEHHGVGVDKGYGPHCWGLWDAARGLLLTQG